MKMDKILLTVDEDCICGSIDTSVNDRGVTAAQLMYAACMLIDTLLNEDAFTLDEILDIVKDIPNAEVSDIGSRSALWN